MAVDLTAESESLRRAVEYGRGRGHETLIVSLDVLAAMLDAAAERDALVGLDPAGVDELLERWDKTEPHIQRAIVARFAGKCVELTDQMARLHKALTKGG